MKEQHSLLDVSQLEALKELNEPGENDVVSELIEIFAKSSPKTISQLKDAVKNRDAINASKLGHKLKGSAANLGGRRLRFICQDMELEARNPDWPALEKLLVEIENCYLETIAILKKDWFIPLKK